MPQTNLIDVRIISAPDCTSYDFKGVHYVSFVSSPGGAGEGTFGIPAILSDERRKAEGLPLKVLYVNPANITAMEAVRKR
jgi:hypothetical protein